MKTLMLSTRFLLIASLLAACSVNAQSLISISPVDVDGLSSYSTSGGEVTLEAFSNGVSGTFEANGTNTLMGITGGETGDAFDNTASEYFTMDFAKGYGLSEMVFQWYGITLAISGFSTDPSASGTHSNGSPIATSFDTDTLTVELPYDGAYWGQSAALSFGNLSASVNGSLVVSTTADGSRTSLNSITVVPEPGMFALLGGMVIFGLVLLRRCAR